MIHLDRIFKPIKKYRNHLLAYIIFSIITISCDDTNHLILYGETMGTTYTVKVNNPKNVKVWMLQAQVDSILNSINNIFSTYIPNSEISQFNNTLTINKIKASDEFIYVLNKAKDVYINSDNHYDITINKIMKLWSFNKVKNEYSIPSKNVINDALKIVGLDKIIIHDNDLQKISNNVEIDCNSLAKGYAVDRISQLLEKKNIDNYMVDIGGEIRAQGVNAKGKFWSVGIQNPENNGILSKLELQNISIATSGDYNNFIVINEKEYPHIINPKTGYPIDNNISSATVLSRDCIDADAYATALMVMKVDEGIKMINGLDGFECMIITTNNNGNFNYHYSKGFK